MRVTIEDLESLKELNDELEENHVEAEKQLNRDIGKHCSLLIPMLIAVCLKTPLLSNSELSDNVLVTYILLFSKARQLLSSFANLFQVYTGRKPLCNLWPA